MNGAHLHLLLNHVPVILAPAGLVILALGLVRRSTEVLKVGLAVIVAAALFTVPTYFSGEKAADVVGDLSGVNMDDIEHHAVMAVQAFVAIGVTGLVALAALLLGLRGKAAPFWLVITTLVLAVIASGWLALTANLGGLIRHPEIREPAAAQR